MSAPPSWDNVPPDVTFGTGTPAQSAPAGALACRQERGQERRTDRQDQIIGALREQIVSGELAPGDRLPNRVDIESRFGASSATVQRALERLKDEGFVVANRRLGTFVSAEPPHLTHYALVMPSRPGQLEWNRFWEALCQEARQLDAAGEFRMPIFYDVNGHEDSEDYQGLMRAMANRRLAGIVFGNTPHPLKLTPIVTELNIPAVAIATSTDIPGLALVQPDRQAFYRVALNHLADRGCRGVAIIDTVEGVDHATRWVNDQGIPSRPYWIQGVSLWQPAAARGLAHLLMNPNQQERPDAIVITNDNLVEPTTLGMRDAGINEHNCPLIVAHSNFPYPTVSHLPVLRLGYSVPEILRLCVGHLKGVREGKTLPGLTAVPVQFETEIAPLAQTASLWTQRV